MARIRTIKPDFWTDEKIGKMKRDERLLFIGLWNLADDQGVLKSNAGYIKGQLFSYDEELRTSTVNIWLSSLEKALMIVPFTLNDESYYVIRTFHDHQLINRPSKPKFDQALINVILNIDSQDTHGGFSEGSQPERKGNRREIEKGNESEKFSPFDEAFNDFLEMRKKIKKPATTRAIELIKIELFKLSNDVNIQILILEQSIKKSWQDVYPLKEDFKKEKGSAEKEKPSKLESNMNAINEANAHLKQMRHDHGN